MKQKESGLALLWNGIATENPVLVLLLGTCPSLAVTTYAGNSLGMGLATTFVLIGSNLVISMIKKLIPASVRIPCYIVVIAGFVTIVKQMMMAYAQPLYLALGVFLDLIVVNCILLGRAELFASRHSAGASFFDGLGMGLGFTLALFAIGSIRELFGNASWMGIPLGFFQQVGVFAAPAGGFFVYGILIALTGILQRRQGGAPRKSFGCTDCSAKKRCRGKDEPLNGDG